MGAPTTIPPWMDQQRTLTLLGPTTWREAWEDSCLQWGNTAWIHHRQVQLKKARPRVCTSENWYLTLDENPPNWSQPPFPRLFDSSLQPHSHNLHGPIYATRTMPMKYMPLMAVKYAIFSRV
jgi:hypothetical protein